MGCRCVRSYGDYVIGGWERGKGEGWRWEGGGTDGRRERGKDGGIQLNMDGTTGDSQSVRQDM